MNAPASVDATPHDPILGALDVRDRVPDRELADRCRELTFAWTRWSYDGPIVEHSDPNALLAAAAATGARHCLVQATGHVALARQRPKGSEEPGLVERLISALGERAWLVGQVVARATVRDTCWLVDLRRWHALGRPALARDPTHPWLHLADDAGLAPFPEPALDRCVALRPEEPAHAAALRGPPGTVSVDGLAPDLARFLTGAARTLDRSQRGVFVWNIERYEDLTFGGDEPLDALRSVAAGFKPNAILRACGFHARTQVVLMDYSAQALEFRRALVETWDGRDLPEFLWPRIRRGSPDAHYWLRSTEGQDAPARDELDALWARELDDWGGADAFAAHWDATRRLPHRYVLVDLLRDPARALADAVDGPSVTWWSNAFSSVHALWHLRYAERAAAYAAWISALAGRCPQSWLLGADVDNTLVAGIKAGDYAPRRAAWRGGMHEPLRCAGSLRF